MWKHEIKQRLPGIIHPVRVARWLAYQCQYPGTAWRIQSAANGRVISGPFKGVRIPTWQSRSSFSELLGTYEHDLHPVIENVIARKPKTVINAGAAYGYYALGFAKRLPQARVIAYESDVTRAKLVKKFAQINDVAGQIEFRGLCTAGSLAADLVDVGHAFVIMDIEGAEASVLEPAILAQMRQVELLIEMHEMFVPGVTDLLRERFAATHRTTLIPQTPVPVDKLDLAAYGIAGIDRKALAGILDDMRGHEMAWLHLEPRPLN